jgi:acyl carrier protein
VVGVEPTVVVADLQQPQTLAALLSLRPSPLLGDLPEARRITQVAEAQRRDVESAGSAIREQLRALPEAKRAGLVVDLVRTHAAAVLGHSSVATVGVDKAFRELGVDSLAAIEIRNQLVAATGLIMPASLVFDYPTARVLADYLLGQILPDSGSPAVDSDEESEMRAALGSLSLAQLRQSGLLEPLLLLSRRSTGGIPTSDGESIETMELEDLAEAVLKGQFEFSSDERS